MSFNCVIHTTIEPACLNCRLVDFLAARDYATRASDAARHLVEGYTKAASQGQGSPGHADHERLRQKAHADMMTWSDVAASYAKKMDQIYDELEAELKPFDATEAKENRILELMEEQKNKWAEDFRNTNRSQDATHIELVPEATNTTEAAGPPQPPRLDLAKIPATADHILLNPVGFGILLRRAKRAGVSVADVFKDDCMSYGAAFEMFGPPSAQGDASKEDELCGAADRLSPNRPTTEYEHRMANEPGYDVPSRLTLAEQYALFEPNKYGLDAAMLIGWYAAHASAKDKDADNVTVDDPSNESASTAPTWPKMGPPTFTGLTNWIDECRTQQPKFASTILQPWAKARDADTKNAVAAIKTWDERNETVPSTMPAHDPQRYKTERSILEEDLEELARQTR